MRVRVPLLTDEVIAKEEIWANIKSLPPDKASGPNGYTDAFIKWLGL
jgi:hypothetical protein